MPARPTVTSCPLAVFDLDGTLADVRHRLHFLDRKPRDWESFFTAAPADPPLPEGIELVRASAAQGHEVVYLTGRPERCRQDTLDWLARQDLPAGRLLMREGSDRRPAATTKPEIMRRLAGDRSVALIADDDRLVCEAFRAAGYHVVRADWMTGSTSLEQAQEQEGRT